MSDDLGVVACAVCFLGAFFVGAALSANVSAPFAERIVLVKHYGEQEVDRQDLRLVKTLGSLVVSNGDVLPERLFVLYGLLQMVSVVIGSGCAMLLLWKLNTVVLEPRGITFIRNSVQELNVAGRPAKR